MKPVIIAGPQRETEQEPPSWFVAELARLKKAAGLWRISPSTLMSGIASLIVVLLAMCAGGWGMYIALRADIADNTSELRVEMQAVREESLEATASLGAELRVEIVASRDATANLGTELRAEMASGRTEFNEDIRRLDDRVDQLDVRVALAEQSAGLTPTSSADAAARADVDSRLERQQVRLANIQLRLDVLQGLLGQVPPSRDAAQAERQLAATPHDEANVWVDQLLSRIGSVEGALAN